jgi:NitT/TauT family transport system ATP-binding protein
MLNMIGGFIKPSQGVVHVGDGPVIGPSPERGMVFQDYSLFPWLTVLGNVEFGLRMAELSRPERRKIAYHYLHMVGLDKTANRYPFELSGGMKQRVAIARALATNPQVLLLDEPFAALDAMTRSELQKQLLEIHARERKTIVFVTHNIGEAIFLASRVIVMSANPGRIIEDFTIELPHPRRRTSAKFNALHERMSAAIGLELTE